MVCIELWPSIDRCIESTAKEEFWNLVRRYPGGSGEDRTLEERIEVLRAFLESANLRSLRSQSENHLIEGRKVKFVICLKDGELDYRMEVVDAI